MRLDTMLVAVDFSDTATHAAHWAAREFAPRANVVLLHVIDPPSRPRFAHDSLPEEETLEAVAREYASTHLRALADEIGRPEARIEIRVGKPHEQVAAVAAEVRADLVVIGPHGDRPRPSRFLGTTADRITRTSRVPILIATSPRQHPPKRLLVPFDEGEITPHLMDWTDALAERFDARVTLLHVWSNAVYSHVASMSYAEKHSDAGARAEIEKELAETARQWLEELVPDPAARGRYTSMVSYGHAGDVVLERAQRDDVDLIVIGRTGAGLVKPALLGSTTDTVLHGARCPVLVVTRDDEIPSSPR